MFGVPCLGVGERADSDSCIDPKFSISWWESRFPLRCDKHFFPAGRLQMGSVLIKGP